MPVRNGMPWLEEALASVRAQNQAVEVTVIDDGSTDHTREYLRSLNGFCARVLESAGRGPAAARNAGIRASASDLLAFLDTDDLWPAGTLDALARTLAESPETGFAQGLIRDFRAAPGAAPEFLTPPYRFLNLGACMWRRSVFETVGMLDEGLRLGEDMDFLTRCWEKDVRKAEVDKVTLLYRRHPASMTRGLSGAEGSVDVYQRRINRIRGGHFNPAAPRHCSLGPYLGIPARG